MRTTVFVDVGRGGHRHLHVRLLFEYLMESRPDLLQHVWFCLRDGVALSAASGLDEGHRRAFRERLVGIKDQGRGNSLTEIFEVARKLSAEHLVFLDIDPFLYALAWRRLPLHVSGVWFRPNYHYRAFGLLHEGVRQRIVGTVKREVARRLCRNPTVDRLLVFDPWAAQYAEVRFRSPKIEYVPDPFGFDTRPPVNGVRRPDRLVFSILGSISARKGLDSILQALTCLTRVDQERIELRVIGRSEAGQRPWVERIIEEARRKTATRLVHVDDFVSDERIEGELATCDVLLLTYRNFIGSSGLLLRAARYCRPVIATKYGLIGALVKKHDLGLTVDPNVPKEIAGAMTTIARAQWCSSNPNKGLAFAAAHRPEVYVQALANTVCQGRVR